MDSTETDDSTRGDSAIRSEETSRSDNVAQIGNGTRAPSDEWRCPKCSAGTLRPSRCRRRDWMAALLGLKPYRCSRCNGRTYRKPKSAGK